MDDLIKRQDAIDAVLDKENHDVDYHDAEFAFNDALIVATNAISDVPSAQKKGHWVDGKRMKMDGTYYWFRQCSVCDYERDDDDSDKDTNFCPNCGADMRGDDNA